MFLRWEKINHKVYVFPGYIITSNRETHFTRDMCFPDRLAHLSYRDMCFVSKGTRITRDMCFLSRGSKFY